MRFQKILFVIVLLFEIYDIEKSACSTRINNEKKKKISKEMKIQKIKNQKLPLLPKPCCNFLVITKKKKPEFVEPSIILLRYWFIYKK